MKIYTSDMGAVSVSPLQTILYNSVFIDTRLNIINICATCTYTGGGWVATCTVTAKR